MCQPDSSLGFYIFCHFGLAKGAPSGGAGGDGGAGELGLATGAVAAFLPTVLKKPALGRDLRNVAAGGESFAGVGEESFVFVGDVLEGSSGDELGLFAQGGGIELSGGGGGMEIHAPANFVCHPVADAGEARLVEDEGFEAGAGSLFQQALYESEGEAGVEDFGGEGSPRFRVFVEVGAAELTIVVVDEGEAGEADEEVVVLVSLVVSGSDGEAARHPEMDFEGQNFVLLLEGEEEPLAVGMAGDHLRAGEGRLDGDGGGIAIDAGLGVGLDGDDLFPQSRGPNAAGEFDFGEFRHGVALLGGSGS